MKEDVVKTGYWVCIIGPTDQDALPQSADAPLRLAAQAAFERLTGQDAKFCSSGWGVDEDAKERIVVALSDG